MRRLMQILRKLLPRRRVSPPCVTCPQDRRQDHQKRMVFQQALELEETVERILRERRIRQHGHG